MENKNETTLKEKAQKPTHKRQGKIEQIYALHKQGIGVKDLSKKFGLGERIIRAYVWRKENPTKYAALLKRYFDKKKAKVNAGAPADKPWEAEKREKKKKPSAQS